MEGSTIKTTTVRAGTYSIANTVLNFDSSASDNGETWIPYQGEIVIIDGGGTGYITGNASNLTIEGLTFQNMVEPRRPSLALFRLWRYLSLEHLPKLSA